MINVIALTPIAKRAFFKTEEFGKIVMKRRFIVIQLVSQYVDRVNDERKYEFVLHSITFDDPTVI
jgi:hypothetical protein